VFSVSVKKCKNIKKGGRKLAQTIETSGDLYDEITAKIAAVGGEAAAKMIHAAPDLR
jgi:hypothetical protein